MIKARVNKKRESVCDECGANRDNCLDLFDFKISGKIVTLCDKCTDDLFFKTLSCTGYVNHRVKTPKDTRIIRARNAWKNKLKDY